LSTVQRIAKNTTVLLISQVASYLLTFFYMMYTARYLGAAGFGILSFAIAFTGIFAVLADLGLRPLTVREVARDRSLALKYLANISLIKVILVTITFGLIALVINLMGYPQQTVTVVYLVALSVIFMSFTQMFYSIFQAHERMEYQSLGQVLYAALMLGGVMFVIKHDFSVVGFASLFPIATVIILGYSLLVMRLKFSGSESGSSTRIIEFNWNFWKLTIREAFPFFLSSFVAVIAFSIDMIMLSIMKGDTTVGWYSAAHKLIEALLFVPAVFGASLYPVLSKFYVSSDESLKLAYQKSLQYLLIVSLPIAVGTTILADRIITIVYQSGFAESVTALQILIWAVPIIFLTNIFGITMASINRQPLALKINVSCMLLNVVLNLILIPRYSLLGASVATVATSLLSLVLGFRFLSRLVHKVPIHKLIVKPVITSVIMGLYVFLLRDIHFLLLICSAVVIYFGVLFLLKTFSKEDFSMFRKVVGIE
jgi:O-antigen/teichoic acid export membrane protein